MDQQDLGRRSLTSGQHSPLAAQLHPYASFPKSISGPTVWRADELTSDLEKWVRHWTPQELEEINDAIEAFLSRKLPLSRLSKETFPLPVLSDVLQLIKTQLLHGRGFILLRVLM